MTVKKVLIIPRFPTEINLIDPVELGMNLDDFNQSEEVFNKSFRKRRKRIISKNNFKNPKLGPFQGHPN